MNQQAYRQILETLVLSLLGGLMLWLLHFPLPWLLGPMTAVLCWRMATRRTLRWPGTFRNAGLILIGYMLGLSFTFDTLMEIVHQIPFMLLVTGLMILFSLLIGWGIARVTGIDYRTTLIGTMPGGLSQMVVLGEELDGVDGTVVTSIQLTRLLSVLFIVPFIVVKGIGQEAAVSGAVPDAGEMSISLLPSWLNVLAFLTAAAVFLWGALRFKFPTPYLMGPMLGSALLTIFGLKGPVLPDVLVDLSQLLLGAHIGCVLNPRQLTRWKYLGFCTVSAAIAMVLFSLLLGYLLSILHHVSFVTAFLSTAPGGIAEMGVTAAQVGADLSVVSGYQTFRIFFILLVVSPLIRWAFKRLAKEKTLK